MIKQIYNTSKEVKNNRTTQSVFYKVVEEIGELSTEIAVKYCPTTYKKADKDGIFGECCDVLISVMDILFLEGYTEEQIQDKIGAKLDKWKNLSRKGEEDAGE